jgi:hypothetical protein
VITQNAQSKTKKTPTKPTPAAATTATAPAMGVIRAGESYILPLFLRLTHQREWSWRKVKAQARAAGIQLDRKVGSTSWVRGDDWLAFLETCTGRDGGGESSL